MVQRGQPVQVIRSDKVKRQGVGIHPHGVGPRAQTADPIASIDIRQGRRFPRLAYAIPVEIHKKANTGYRRFTGILNTIGIQVLPDIIADGSEGPAIILHFPVVAEPRIHELREHRRGGKNAEPRIQVRGVRTGEGGLRHREPVRVNGASTRPADGLVYRHLAGIHEIAVLVEIHEPDHPSPAPAHRDLDLPGSAAGPGADTFDAILIRAVPRGILRRNPIGLGIHRCAEINRRRRLDRMTGARRRILEPDAITGGQIPKIEVQPVTEREIQVRDRSGHRHDLPGRRRIPLAVADFNHFGGGRIPRLRGQFKIGFRRRQ